MRTTSRTVRRAETADMSALDALFARSYPVLLKPDYPPSVLVTAIPLISKAQPKLIASRTFFVVEEEGQLWGAGGWTRQAPGGMAGTHQTGNIRHVVTDHRRVRGGIGRLLMEHVLSDAKTAGMQRMQCQSTRTAVPFYEAMGFKAQGEISVPLRPGIEFPAVFMTRDL